MIVTVSSHSHTIKTPLADLHVGDVVAVFDEDTQLPIANVEAIDNDFIKIQDPAGGTILSHTDCSLCPLHGRKICQYHWEDENGILHALCESKAFINDPNADDIRLRSLDDILEHIGG